MIVAAYENGKIMRYLKEQDSEAKYASSTLQEEGTEVSNIRIAES